MRNVPGQSLPSKQRRRKSEDSSLWVALGDLDFVLDGGLARKQAKNQNTHTLEKGSAAMSMRSIRRRAFVWGVERVSRRNCPLKVGVGDGFETCRSPLSVVAVGVVVVVRECEMF